MSGFIPYGRQDIRPEDVEEVVKVLKSDFITQGPKIAEFEAAVAAAVGARHAVAVSSGTAALHAACYAAGVGPGDEVVTSPITFVASANCARLMGASVRFADVRPDTACMDPGALEAALAAGVKAVIPVDFAGQPCDMDEVLAACRARRAVVISDAAHSLGARYKGRPVGSLADMTVFSFHPVKHVTTGEGGLVATDSGEYARRLRLFRTHGITGEDGALSLPRQAADKEGSFPADANPDSKAPWYYEMQDLGCNYRITDLQCALGLSQLRRLPEYLARRRAIAARYDEAFQGSPFLGLPFRAADRESAWHLYVLRLRLDRMTKTRRRVFEDLRARGVGVQVHYIPVHLQPYYRRLGHGRGQLPNAEAFYDSALTVPLFPAMSDADVSAVIQAVLETVS